METMAAATMDVVVVYQRQEFYVLTQLTSPNQGTLAVELLQCQLLSLVGVAPDDQILLSSSGEVLFSPRKAAVATIPVPKLSRSRFFLFSSAGAAPEAPEMTSDWRQICTKSTFGRVAVSQPAFRKTSSNGSDAASTLICEPCARTCTTGFQPVNPMEWDASKAIASRFISEIVVVAGDVDVAPPPGFTKLPTDLNYSASGDYVYLCVQRGGPHALTQLHVLFQQCEEAPSKPKEGSLLPERVIEVNCSSGGAADNGMGVDIRIGYDSVLRQSNLEQLEMLAITDIAVVIGDQPPPSPAYVKITRNLNEGSPHAHPIYLFYQLSPLNGFVCDSGREHSEFGECLFASRHLLGLTNVFDMDEQRLATGLPALSAQRTRNDAAFMETQYRQRQPGMLGRLKGGLQRAQSYENKQMQAEALKRIPVDELRKRAHANPSPMPHYQDELVKQLLHWFKREFFTWMNQPRCSACNHEKTRSVRTEGPSTAEEIAGQAGRVEVYQCPVCNAFTRFPRYNDPVKLLDTRTGRCGEWANCFTLCCRSMGFEARYVLDVTDHVWTEVYSEHFKRWLHCDSCEDQLDCPLTYEVGWGKKLSYIFSFARDEVVDTARRYTQNWVEMRSRRQDVSEQWLQTTIDQINRELWGQQPPERVAVLRARAQSEREELLRGRSVQSGEVKGRVSGSAEWKNQRSEDGKQTAVATNGEATAGSESQTIRNASESTSTAERLQQICRNLVVGCQKDCPNPYCLIGRTAATNLETSSDVNERAAQAIQVVTALNAKGFSSEALGLLLCPTNSRDLRWFLWKHHPCVYLPLQDSPSPIGSELLIDISGHGNHVGNARQCALRKPFRIPNSASSTDGEGRGDDEAFGLQLLQGQQLVVPAKFASSSTGCMLSFLLRLDQGVTSEANQGVSASVLTVRFCVSEARNSIVFRVIWDPSQRQFACELQSQSGAPTSTTCAGSLIAFGGYAHVAIVQEDSAIAAYVNGTEVVRVQVEAAEAASSAKESVITLEGSQLHNGESAGRPSSAAVLSHLTVMSVLSPQEFADFCNTMKQDFVCAPPLRAFGPNGEHNDQKCSEKAAGAQSGYRIARVLMWGGEFFDGLQFVYEGSQASDDIDRPSLSTVYGALVGNANAKRQASSPAVTLELLPGEVMTQVSGRNGAWTDCLCLHTSFGRAVTCGGKGGGDFSVSTPAGSEIRAISFKIGDHLTDATAFVLDSSPSPLESDTMEVLQQTLAPFEAASRQKAISAVLRYLGNIASQPEEPKFQRIRASNKFFVSNVGALGEEAAEIFMRWCGFLQEGSQHEELSYAFHPVKSPQIQEGVPSQRIAAEAHKRIWFLKALSTE